MYEHMSRFGYASKIISTIRTLVIKIYNMLQLLNASIIVVWHYVYYLIYSYIITNQGVVTHVLHGDT